MTTTIDDSIFVPQPRAVVWAALTDWSRAGEWMAEASDMRQSAGPLSKGSVLSFRAQNRERTSTVVAYAERSLLALASDGPGVRALYTYTLSDEGDGTRVRLVADVAARGAMKLFAPLIRSAIAKADGGQLAAFAAMLSH